MLLTFEKVLDGVGDEAIVETARRFSAGLIEKQNREFAPSSADFAFEARKIEEFLSFRNRARLPYRGNQDDRGLRLEPMEKARLRLKMPMYQHAVATGQMTALTEANVAGFGAMAVLAQKWEIAIPQELLDADDDFIEAQWHRARNIAIGAIERDPPPFMRRASQRRSSHIGKAA